jgi:hypothetical protein
LKGCDRWTLNRIALPTDKALLSIYSHLIVNISRLQNTSKNPK